PIPLVPEAPEGQQVAHEILEAHYAWIKGSKKIAGLMLMTSITGASSDYERFSLFMGKTVNELHAMLKLHEETLTLPKSNAPALHPIQAGKYLAELMKKRKNATLGAGGSSGLEIVLNNCYYAPSITRGVISVSRLYADGFVNRFVDNTIQVSRNNVVYFSAVPRDGASYFVTFTDDFSHYGYVYLLKHKHEVFETFKVFQKKVENQLGKTIKLLRSDRGGEYMSQEFLDHLKDHEIIAYRTPPYTPQHNGVSERRNRTLLDMALVKRDTLTKPDKLEPRSIKCIFVGYPKETMRYSFYYPPKNKVIVARNAEFLENSLIDQEASGSLEDLEIIQEEDTHPSLDTSLNHEEDDLEIDEPQSDIVPICRSTRTRHAPDRMCLYIDAEEHELGELGEPANYKAALLDPNKWLFKKKTDMDGNVHIYKARLVAKGYTQTPGIEYEETFSPVADIRAIRILIAIAAYYDYEIWQMHVKTAFLNGYLNEEVYMEQLEGFVNPKYLNRVCKLKRSIYGLKQASRQCNERFDDEIKKFGFIQNHDEPCVYQKASGSNVTFLILYVDDILIMGNNIPMLQSVKTYLGKCFAMKDLGEAAYILGIKIYKDISKRLIGLCQSAYIEKILKRYCMENSKREGIPMQEKHKLSKSQGASTPAELKRMQNVPYASAVGAIAIANESGITKGARHFRAKVHYLREVIEFGDIKLEKVHTDDNLADPFTKALAFPKHSKHTKNIGMIPANLLANVDEEFPCLENNANKNSTIATGPVSYATLLNDNASRKIVNFHTLLALAGNGADVAISKESIHVVHECSNDGMNAMLENGPWLIRNAPLILKKWSPVANIMKEDLCNIPVWVKFHDIPITAFKEDGLSAIATKLSTLLLLDSYSTAML
nr:hypothetical protein [Tanacetum cinerariifolium]